MISDKNSNVRVRNSNRRVECVEKPSETVQIGNSIKVPIEILCDGDTCLFFIIPFDWVNFLEDKESYNSYKETARYLSTCNNDDKTNEHKDCPSCSFDKIFIQFRTCVSLINNFRRLIRVRELSWCWLFHSLSLLYNPFWNLFGFNSDVLKHPNRQSRSSKEKRKILNILSSKTNRSEFNVSILPNF